MRLIISAIKSSLYSLLVLFIILTSLFVFLVTTTPGLFITINLVNRILPGKLTIVDLKEQSLNHFSFEKLTYLDNNLQLELNHVDLRWQLLQLLHRHLAIKNLQIGKLNIISGDNTNNINFPHLPITISIEKANINELNISKNKVLNQFNNIYLSANLTNKQWQLQHLDFLYMAHNIHLQASATPTLPYNLTASLDFTPPTNNKTGLKGKINIAGNFFRYYWSGKMSSPAHLTLEGTLTYGTNLHTSATWSEFNWPINSSYTLISNKGQISVDGSLQNLQINLHTELTAPLLSTWQLNAITTPNGVTVNAVISAQQGEINLAAAYDKTKSPRIQGTVKGITLDNAIALPITDVKSDSQFQGDSLANLSIYSQITARYLGNYLKAILRYQEQKLNAFVNLGPNHLEITGASPFPWKLAATLPAPAMLHPSLKGLNTTITANALLSNDQKAAINVKIGKGKLENTATSALLFAGGELRANLDATQLQANGNFAFDSTKTLSLTLNLPKFCISKASLRQPINGNIKLNFNSLAFLNDLSHTISNAEGELQAILNVLGTLEKPIIDGNLNLLKASVALPKMGITLNPVQFSLQSRDMKWKAKGAIMSNANALTIEGNGELFPTIKGLFSIHGDNFMLVNTPELLANISPKLTVEFAPDVFKLRGTLLIPKAQVKPQSFTDTVSLSNDAVFVGEEPPPANPLNMDTDVQIEIGNDVELAVKGLQGFLIGKVKLHQLPNEPLTGNGELNIRDGKYHAYGQDLIIKEGKLLFNGSLIDNPGINIRAIRKFNNASATFSGSNQLFDFNPANMQTLDLASKTTVGIEVAGQLTAPKVKLFSIPANLSQADILSMLLLGKPANQASKSGGQLLMAAVSALNINSGDGKTQLLDQLKQNFGLDFNVENQMQYDQKTKQSTENTAFVVSKSISKRLYLNYNVGITQTDNNVLTLKYLLNKFFSIQVNASTSASGIDLLYTHKKG